MSGNMKKLRTPTCLMGAIYLAMLHCGSADVRPWYFGGVALQATGQEILLARAEAEKKDNGTIFNLHMAGDETSVPLSGSSGWRVAKKSADAKDALKNEPATAAPKAEPTKPSHRGAAKTEAAKAEPVKEAPKAEPAKASHKEAARAETAKAEPVKETPKAEPAKASHKEAARAETAKADPVKETPKAEPAKASHKEAAKAETAKSEAPKAVTSHRRKADTIQPTLFLCGETLAVPLACEQRDAGEKVKHAPAVHPTAKPEVAASPAPEAKPARASLAERRGRSAHGDAIVDKKESASQPVVRKGRRQVAPQAVATNDAPCSTLPSVFVLTQENEVAKAAPKAEPRTEKAEPKAKPAAAPKTAHVANDRREPKDYPAILEGASPKVVEPAKVATPAVKEEAALNGEKIRYFQSDLQSVPQDEVRKLRTK